MIISVAAADLKMHVLSVDPPCLWSAPLLLCVAYLVKGPSPKPLVTMSCQFMAATLIHLSSELVRELPKDAAWII